MNLQEYKKKALKDQQFKKEYEKYDLALEIGQMLIEARIKKGITQEKLAQLIRTKQPSIARLENGKHLPSLSILNKIAKALNTYLLAPKFAFLENTKMISTIKARSSTTYQENSTPRFLTIRLFSNSALQSVNN